MITIFVFREKSGRESVIVKLNEEYKTVAVTNIKVRAYLPCFVSKMLPLKQNYFITFFVLTLITLHALMLHSSYCPDDAFESSHGAYVLDVHTFKFQAFLPPLHRQQSTQTDRQTSALLALLSVCHYNDSLLKPHSFKITFDPFDNTNIVYIHFNF